MFLTSFLDSWQFLDCDTQMQSGRLRHVLFPSKRKKAIISLIKRPRTILRPEMDSLLLGKNHATCTACTRLTFCVGASSGSSGRER